jgi:hypothetical protein
MYTRPNSSEKLSKKQVLDALQSGAVLTRHFGVYGYWDLTYPDGTRHYNIRKNATNGISPRLIANLVEISRNKDGYVYRILTLEELAKKGNVNVISIGNKMGKKVVGKSILYFDGARYCLRSGGISIYWDDTSDLLLDTKENRKLLTNLINN